MFSFVRKSGPPDAAAVLKRAVILKCLMVKTLAMPPQEFLETSKSNWSEDEWNAFLKRERSSSAEYVKRLHENGLWKEMEQGEQQLFQAGVTELTMRQRIDVSWLTESAVCLLWALGYISEIPPFDEQADLESTNRLPQESLSVLAKKAALRASDIIQKQRDIAELWHWRSRTRQLQEANRMPSMPPGNLTVKELLKMTSSEAAKSGDIPSPIRGDFPAYGKAYRDLTREEFASVTSIAQERHRALNWLCGLAPGNRWSETPTDT